MRMGAIFARGSCRALKWMALFGVVFALGAGSAAAQQQLSPDATFDDDGVKVEGLGKTIGEGTGVAVKVTLRATVPGGAAADADPTRVAVTVVVAPAPGPESPTNDTSDNSDDGDIILNPQNGQVTVNFPPNTGADPKKDTQSATVFLQTNNDLDAEREDFAVTITVDGNGFSLTPSGTAADDVEAGLRIESTITDDEDQTYVLTVSTKADDRKENSTITGTGHGESGPRADGRASEAAPRRPGLHPQR